MAKLGRAERINAAQKRLAQKQPTSGETVSMPELRRKGKVAGEIKPSDAAMAQAQETAAEALTPPPARSNGKGNAKSIRSLIMGMLVENRPTPEIAEQLRAQFPQSAAAAKSAKHISFYRSLMKKEAKRAAE